MSYRRYPRPTSVSVVCYFLLILGGVAGVIRAILTYSRPAALPMETPVSIAEILIGLIDSILMAVCAIFMLRGANWARILFYAGCVLTAIAAMAAGFTGFGVQAAVWLVVGGAVLALPGANRFFLGRERPRGESGPETMQERELLRPESRGRHSRNRYDY